MAAFPRNKSGCFIFGREEVAWSWGIYVFMGRHLFNLDEIFAKDKNRDSL
jgi:hypothetical protein